MNEAEYLPVFERVGNFGAAEINQAMRSNSPMIKDEYGDWLVMHFKETFWGRGQAVLRLVIPSGGLSRATIERLRSEPWVQP